MKRLTIKKLIVISQSESRSLEVPFENGLNIILGGNKTGNPRLLKVYLLHWDVSAKGLNLIGKS